MQHKIQPMISIDRKHRLARLWSNNELRKIDHLFTGDIVNVSAGENIDKEGHYYDQYFPNKRSFHLTNYAPGKFRGYEGRENEHLFDLSQEAPAELVARFDVVFNHTVLEHIFDIKKAFQNLCLLSKDIVIVVVPFSQVQHESDAYQDYWRFCPAGMRGLFNENGLEVIYESCNNDINSGIYLFYVASHHPDKWKKKMPPYEQIVEAGNRIGYVPPLPASRIARLRLKMGLWLLGKHKQAMGNYE